MGRKDLSWIGVQAELLETEGGEEREEAAAFSARSRFLFLLLLNDNLLSRFPPTFTPKEEEGWD